MMKTLLTGLGATALLASPALAQAGGDATSGARLFLQCRACHTVAATARDGVGPNLYGIVGAKAAARPGYSYSPALAKAAIVWTPDALDKFLAKPTALVPGIKMVFAGVPVAKARADLIAYLATLSPAKP